MSSEIELFGHAEGCKSASADHPYSPALSCCRPSSATPGEWVTDADVLAALRRHVATFQSQKEFAAAMGRSESYVSDVLNGRRLIPDEWANAVGFRHGWHRVTQPQERAGSEAGAWDGLFIATADGVELPIRKREDGKWELDPRYSHYTRPQPASDASGGDDLDAWAQRVAVQFDAMGESYDAKMLRTLSRALAESRGEQSAMFLRAREWAERYGAAERSLAEAVAMANRIVNFSDLEMQDGDAAREVCAAFVAAQEVGRD